MGFLHLSRLLWLAVVLLSPGLGWGVSSLRLRTSAKILSLPVDFLVLAPAEPLGCDLLEVLWVGPPWSPVL